MYFLPIFLIFLLVLAYFLRKGNRTQEEINQQFWEQERKANFTRKKDLDTLEYIQLPAELLPGNLHTEAEQALLAMTDKKMLNLTQYTNTELKMKYGPSNLEALSDFESNYINMIAQLITYAGELIQNSQHAEAQKLLEFAVSCQDDSVRIYEMLAKTYRNSQNEAALFKLSESAEALTSINKKSILEKIAEYTTGTP